MDDVFERQLLLVLQRQDLNNLTLVGVFLVYLSLGPVQEVIWTGDLSLFLGLQYILGNRDVVVKRGQRVVLLQGEIVYGEEFLYWMVGRLEGESIATLREIGGKLFVEDVFDVTSL